MHAPEMQFFLLIMSPEVRQEASRNGITERSVGAHRAKGLSSATSEVLVRKKRDQPVAPIESARQDIAHDAIRTWHAAAALHLDNQQIFAVLLGIPLPRVLRRANSSQRELLWLRTAFAAYC